MTIAQRLDNMDARRMAEDLEDVGLEFSERTQTSRRQRSLLIHEIGICAFSKLDKRKARRRRNFSSASRHCRRSADILVQCHQDL